ncbi:MAG: Lipopolysaccharide heptosyltransferase 1 [Chlamydiae bacterium]|nr:Lipopolysaccharide heptosyltransferase 1 [Chlamydiota bacterium]
MKKFLIVKTSSLGDIVQCYPVVAYLKKKFPDSQIDWMVEKPFAELITAHPDITRTIEVQTKRWRRSPLSRQTRHEFGEFKSQLRTLDYDLIIELQGNTKSGFLGFQAKGKVRLGFGRKTVAEFPNLLFTNKRINPPEGQNIREDYLAIVKTYFHDTLPFEYEGIKLVSDFDPNLYLSNEQKNILVCPGAHWINKQLPLKTMTDFLKGIPSGQFLLVWGNEKEREFVEQIQKEIPNSQIIPRLPLPELQNLMSAVDLVITMDSLPLHLAGTTSTPTYSIFGPSLAEKYRPLGSQHHSFQGPCPYHQKFKKRCPKLRSCRTGACIRCLDPEEMINDFLTSSSPK